MRLIPIQTTGNLMMNEYLHAYLQYRVLNHRFNYVEGDGHSIDEMLALARAHGVTDENGDPLAEELIAESLELKNVCAKLPTSLVDRLESTLQVLHISKREFIEIAIIAAIDEAVEIMAENGVAFPSSDKDLEAKS